MRITAIAEYSSTISSGTTTCAQQFNFRLFWRKFNFQFAAQLILTNFYLDFNQIKPEIFVTSPNVTFAVGIHESHWRYHFNGYNITRAIMMTALQNVKRIFVRGTSSADFTQVV